MDVSSLKPLKSVAHNLAHQFASILNYWYDDYAIHHLAKAAKLIDVLNGTVSPPEIKSGVVAEIIPTLKASLASLLEKEGVSPELVNSATLSYNFDVGRKYVLYNLPTYECVSSLSTVAGKTYEAHLTESNN
jgi:hypothetical protein